MRVKANNTIKVSMGAVNAGLRAGLIVVAVVLVTACSIFRDDPTSLALKHIKALVTMPEVEYQQTKNNIALREQASINYLRARIVQNATFTFEIEAMSRPQARQREITVSISEKRATGPSHERARFWAQVELNGDNNWHVVSIRLVE